jgi:YD repeat-containing protein
MAIDVNKLSLHLAQHIDQNLGSNRNIEKLMLARAVEQLRLNVVNVAGSQCDLPCHTGRDGELYFVTDQEQLYWANPTYGWLSLAENFRSTLWTWGANYTGQLGTGNTTDRSSPGTTAGAGTTWCQTSAGGYYHTTAIKTDGTLWTWGGNNYGQLGDGTINPRSSPVTTAGAGTTWCQVSASGYHTAAVKTDGTLWTWGYNGLGRLGTGTTTDRSSPGTTAGAGTTWCQVSTGGQATMAVKTDGTLWTWGYNRCGRLGTGTTTDQSSPVTTAGAGTTWCQVTTNGYHTAAVKTDGTLWTWGYNGLGRLGTGTTTDRSSPGTTAGAGTTWCQVGAGYRHTMAIKTDGTLWTWGGNNFGQLGDNTTTDQSSPGTTAGAGTTWCQVSASGLHTMAIKTDGTLWTWGRNIDGRLGDGTTTSRSSPGTTAGAGTTWCQVSAGSGHTTAIRADPYF